MFLWLNFLYLYLFLNVVMCQRRVVGGQRVDKNYMVYLVPALPKNLTQRRLTSFFCGGSIISPLYVLSSAACILNNNRKWVISGYNKYLTKHDIGTDKCALKYARKIVYECAHTGTGDPKANDVNVTHAPNWHQGDVGLAKVESPFNFQDQGYYQYCSYPPRPISFTTVQESAIAGADAMVLGWGSTRYHRPPGQDHDINEKYLMGATTVVSDTKLCRDIYKKSLPAGVHVDQVFNKYTICTQGISEINIYGKYAGTKARRDSNNKTIKFEDLYLYYHTTGDTVTYYSTSGNKIMNSTRRSSDPGPCQNDHGGPLVVWFGGREYLAGIASAFLVNEHMECVGPYLYRSITSAAKFLNCTMGKELFVQKQCKDCNTLVEDDIDFDKPIESSSNKSQDYWLYSD